MNEKKIQMPDKLDVKGDYIRGFFSSELNFVEGTNGKDYPTCLFTTHWYQFAPSGFDDMRTEVMKKW